MQNDCAEKSQKVLDTLNSNIELFKVLLSGVEDEQTRQNILRSMILFICSGVDAVVKQLIFESLVAVIERDEGAQKRLRDFTERKIKKNSELNYSFFAELLTVRDSRNFLIQELKKELSFDSLQSSEQLYKVASYFNIGTDRIVDRDDRETLRQVFLTRNRIVHQMDIDFEKSEIHYFTHSLDEVNAYYKVIQNVSQNFISEVNEVLKKEVSKDYIPLFSVDDEGYLLTNIMR